MIGDLRGALRLMKSALAKLDAAEAPAEIGAHLDLVICRLEEVIDRARAPANSDSPRETEPNARF